MKCLKDLKHLLYCSVVPFPVLTGRIGCFVHLPGCHSFYYTARYSLGPCVRTAHGGQRCPKCFGTTAGPCLRTPDWRLLFVHDQMFDISGINAMFFIESITSVIVYTMNHNPNIQPTTAQPRNLGSALVPARQRPSIPSGWIARDSLARTPPKE